MSYGVTGVRRRPQHLSCGALACIQAPGPRRVGLSLDPRAADVGLTPSGQARQWSCPPLAGAAVYRSGKPAGGPAWPNRHAAPCQEPVLASFASDVDFASAGAI